MGEVPLELRGDAEPR